MKTNCPEIDLALKLAKADGSKISEISTGWSNVRKDICMAKPLTLQLKEKIKSEIGSLQYWMYKGSPHNGPDEGFFCEEHEVSISFPINQ